MSLDSKTKNIRQEQTTKETVIAQLRAKLEVKSKGDAVFTITDSKSREKEIDILKKSSTGLLMKMTPGTWKFQVW